MKPTSTVAVVVLCVLGVGVSGRAVRDTSDSLCPPEWDSKPCICQNIPNSPFASVNCDAANDSAQLEKAFAALPEGAKAHFGTFSLSGSNVTKLPSGVFGRASFTFFFITNSLLEKVEEDAFKGSEETAENFLLHNTSIVDFDFKSLRNLKNMKNFELSSSALPAIPDNAFGDKALIEVINLGDNKISSLGQNVFAQLPKLRTIELSNNRLTELGPFALATPASQGPISVLLSHNQIAKIDKNAFQGLKLKTMELEDNKLESLQEDVFRPILEGLPQTQGTLYTLGNPFNCKQDEVQWLQQLPAEQKSLLVGFICRDGRAFQELTTPASS